MLKLHSDIIPECPIVSKKTEDWLESLVIASSQVNHQRVQKWQRWFFVQLQSVRTVIIRWIDKVCQCGLERNSSETKTSQDRGEGEEIV